MRTTVHWLKLPLPVHVSLARIVATQQLGQRNTLCSCERTQGFLTCDGHFALIVEVRHAKFAEKWLFLLLGWSF